METAAVDDIQPPLWVFITFKLDLEPDSSIARVWNALDQAVGRGTVQRIREGHKRLGAETVQTIAKKTGVTASDIQRILDGQIQQAHEVSFQSDTVPLLTWEELMDVKKLPEVFWVTLGDDAMAPRAPKGTKVRFRRAKGRDFDSDGQYGDAVLFLAPDMTHHVRLLGQDLSHGFQLRPTNANYASFVGSMAGLELLGIMTAIETNWQQLDR